MRLHIETSFFSCSSLEPVSWLIRFPLSSPAAFAGRRLPGPHVGSLRTGLPWEGTQDGHPGMVAVLFITTDHEAPLREEACSNGPGWCHLLLWSSLQCGRATCHSCSIPALFQIHILKVRQNRVLLCFLEFIHLFIYFAVLGCSRASCMQASTLSLSSTPAHWYLLSVSCGTKTIFLSVFIIKCESVSQKPHHFMRSLFRRINLYNH